ncbi:MAG: GNAT family N-acetyltransferase [Bacillota bacterium]
MVIVESERLILREFNETDAQALAHIWGDREVMKHCGGAIDDAIIRRVILINREKYRAHGYAVFAVLQKPDGALIGITGCKPDETSPRRGELIYHFCQPVWGKGYASEAVAAYLRWVREQRCMDTISASAVPDNDASIRVLQKNGFTQNGFVQFEDTGFVPEPFFELHLGE